MTDKEQIRLDSVSNFCLVCYYDNKTKELVRIEQYKDNSSDIQTDINSHKYGYNAEIIKPEELINQLACKTQECKKLNNKIIDMNSIIEDAAINLGNKDFTLYDLPFEIKKLRQECENLKAEEKYLKQCCQKAGEELAKHSFEYDGKEKNLVVQAIELNEKYEKFKKALEEIEEVIDSIFDRCPWRKTDSCMPVYNVCEELIKTLDIINKAKGETNA